MKFNICVIQPKDYIHSMAFWELAELLLYSLIDLKQEAIIQFNKIDSSYQNIIIGFHLLDIKYSEQIPKNSILVNAEQFLGGTPWNENILAWIRSFEVWDYSTQNIKEFERMGLTNTKYLQLGYQKELDRIQKTGTQDIDILFYGSINQRRSTILEQLKQTGAAVHTCFGIYGKDRDHLISKSKLVLNLHYYESEIFEVIRVFYLLTNAVTVIGEINPTTTVEKIYQESVIGMPYEKITQTCIKFLEDDKLRLAKGLKGYDAIKANPQKLFTEKLL